MLNAPPFERILVTGGAGFIGQHLLRALLALGHQPLSLTRSLGRVEDLAHDLRDEARWVELDLLNHKAVGALLGAERPTIIFHLAGTRGMRDDDSALADCLELNVDATRNLLENARDSGVARTIITGSADEYGRQSGQISETHPLQPTSSYGISKAEATRVAQALYENEKCPVVILRPFTVYGPLQPQGMFVGEAIECAVSDSPFRMSSGLQKRDLVYVDDVVRALFLAARAPLLDGKIINIGTGRAEQLLDVARLIWKLSETSAPLLVGERPATTHETHDTWADNSLARQLLNWEPQVALEDGLRTTIEWMRRVQHTKSVSTVHEHKGQVA